MSLNTDFPDGREPKNAITERILLDPGHPRITFHVEEYPAEGDGSPPDDSREPQLTVVGAVSDELIVLKAARERSPELNQALTDVAEPMGTLGDSPRVELNEPGATPLKPAETYVRGGFGQPDDLHGPRGVELWRLKKVHRDSTSIDVALRLRELARPVEFQTDRGGTLAGPAVTPNHICVVSSDPDWCPAGPPHSAPPPPPPGPGAFVERPARHVPKVKVVVIDTGYIYTDPPHYVLDERVKSVPGEWFDVHATPPRWRFDPPDEPDADGDGRLDGVAGHGTFIAGLVGHHARQAEITVVGQRHEVFPLPGNLSNPVVQAKLFTTEFSLARSMLRHCNADVLQCGFAFPTLSMYPSTPFAAVMAFLRSPAAPRQGIAVVSPAGNESSTSPYWPAAHPDVVGVAASNRRGNARAYFSNWGSWLDCCTRGQYVLSTYIHWFGPLEGEPLTDLEDFRGWARWDGTSFAAPKVSAAIAELVAYKPWLTPAQAWSELEAGIGGVVVTTINDRTLTIAPVPLPYLHLG